MILLGVLKQLYITEFVVILKDNLRKYVSLSSERPMFGEDTNVTLNIQLAVKPLKITHCGTKKYFYLFTQDLNLHFPILNH